MPTIRERAGRVLDRICCHHRLANDRPAAKNDGVGCDSPERNRQCHNKWSCIADPGIDTAFAVALALNDPALDVLGLLATPGNVTAEQATQNVHTLIEQLDPPRWPKLGPPRRWSTTTTARTCTAPAVWAA